jgi:hypothetical protein
VASEVGKGSTFTIHLPAEVRDPATQPDGTADAKSSLRSRSSS